MPVVRFLRRVHPAELADIITSGECFRSHLRRYCRLCLAVLQNSVRVFISLPTRLEALCTATQCLAKLIRAVHLIAALSIAMHSSAKQCIARQRSASLCTATQCTASLCFENPLLFSSVVIVKPCGVVSLPPRSEVLRFAPLCSAPLCSALHCSETLSNALLRSA